MRDYEVLNPILKDGKVRRSGIVQLAEGEGFQLERLGFVRAILTTEVADPPPAPDNETGATTQINPNTSPSAKSAGNGDVSGPSDPAAGAPAREAEDAASVAPAQPQSAEGEPEAAAPVNSAKGKKRR